MLQSAGWRLAKQHADSLKPGYLQSQNTSSRIKGHGATSKAQIPICENTKQLFILGPGYPLYFIFLKYSIIMIFLLVISYSTLTIFWSYDHNSTFCLQNQPRYGKNGALISCTSWMILLSRLEPAVDMEETVLRITSFITQLFFLLYIREELRKYNSHFHERADPKISDYSILIKNIPKQSSIKAKVQQLFQLAFLGKYTIEHIYPIAYLEQHSQNYAKIEALHKKYLTLMAGKNCHKDQLNQIESQINRLATNNKETNLRFNEMIANDQLVCEKVIVTVNTQKDKQEILGVQIAKDLMVSIFGIGAHKIQFVQAPQPNQIIWENINIPKIKKIRRIIFGWSLFIVLLIAVTIIFYFLLLVKVHEIQKALQIYKEDPVGAEHLKLQALGIVIGCILSIILFNKLLLAKILHYITDIESHKTAAAFELSFSIKYALGLVFTTAILTLLVEDIQFHNIYEHDYGVIQQETIMYFFAAFFIPFIWLSNPWYLAKVVKMYFYYNSNKYTQKEANEIMELPQYSIGKRYAEIIEMVWFTYFYASLIPIGAPLTLVGICLFYWVDKYNLLRKSSVKQNISGDLSMKGLIMLDLTLILKPVGELVFDSQIRSSWTYESVCMIFLGFVYVLLPKDKLLDMINGEKFKLNHENFTQIENSRLQAYNQLNDDQANYHSRQYPQHPDLVQEEKDRIQPQIASGMNIAADLDEQLCPSKAQ